MLRQSFLRPIHRPLILDQQTATILQEHYVTGGLLSGKKRSASQKRRGFIRISVLRKHLEEAGIVMRRLSQDETELKNK
jgi:hypothetical protein